MSINRTFLSSLVIGITFIAAAISPEPAIAKSSKRNNQPHTSTSSADAAARSMGETSSGDASVQTGRPAKTPGPAWRTIGGRIKQIKGDTYTVEDYEGNQIQLYVGKGTKKIRGSKKVGDPVRAEITRGGFANSIQ